MKYYTYLWLRKTGTPYYVGKGSGHRAYYGFRNRVVPPPPKDRIVIQYFESEEEAYEAEKFLISFYGRKDQNTGCLINLTDGGDTPPRINHTGRVRSAEFRQKCRIRQLGTKQSPETIAKRTGPQKGRKMPQSCYSVEWRIKQSLSHKGQKPSLELRQRWSQSKKGKPWPPARRAAYEKSLALNQNVA